VKLVVLGSTGGCGAHLVRDAVARGHEVTAVSRRADPALPAGARGVVADLLDVTALRGAIRGADAVLCAVGLRLPGLAPWAKPEVADVLTRLGPVLVEAMRAEGISRLLAISAGGVGDSYLKVPWVFRMFIRTTSLSVAYAELERFEATLLASGLDVCLPRPTGLTDAAATGQVKVCEDFTGQAQIPRADVAAWMLDEVAQPTMRWRTPMITVTGAGRVVG
jgi:putative NADH-flavin reductase